ncbi:MAG: PAS domain S-box protein [Pirellulales bacterium]|nr:PAS domain S-box protein [Pirellulales bacterium]
MRALVMIDESELRQQVLAELVRLGVEADTVPSNQVDLRVASGNYQLMVGAWQPPDRGLSWCQVIREKCPPRQAILVLATDSTAVEELEQMFDSGADDYLPWPAPTGVLRVRLRVAVERAWNRARREQVERQLLDSVERFKLAVHGANDGLWDLLVHGTVWHLPDTEIWYSCRFKELLGFGQSDDFPPVLASWESRLHPDDHDRIIQALDAHICRREPYDVEYRLRTKSGRYRWFSARGQAISNEAAHVIRMAGSLRDITNAKEAEARLEQSEEKWRSLVENAPEIVVLTDPDGTIRYLNRSLPTALESIGKSIYEYVDDEYRNTILRAFDALMKTGEPQSYEVESHAVGGGNAWYTVRIGPIRQGGQIVSVVLLATNITQRKIVENQLQRERDALRRLLDLQERERQLVSYEIHDGLVQYLTAGLLHLEAAAGKSESMPTAARTDYQRGVSLLREALDEGRRLIGGLRPPILDERGVVESLRYLVSEFQHDIPDLKFIEYAPCGRLAPTLEIAIFRIAQEALSNIRKHSGAKRAQVELLQHGEWLRLIVRDWGKGFDPGAVREDRYGLQGIRQRARLLGTRAITDSKPGGGAAIVVDFPIVLDPAAERD